MAGCYEDTLALWLKSVSLFLFFIRSLRTSLATTGACHTMRNTTFDKYQHDCSGNLQILYSILQLLYSILQLLYSILLLLDAPII